MADNVLRRCVLMLATLAQLAVAIAMIVFVRRLSNVDVDPETQDVKELSCSLNAGNRELYDSSTADDTDLSNQSLCILAYAGASVTLLAMFVLSLLLCLTCNLCGVGWVVEVIVQGVLCTGWVIYSIWVTRAARTIDGWETVPAWDTDSIQNARTTVVALSWAEVFLTGLVALSILGHALCGGRSYSDRKSAWYGDNRV